jgi:hypothetical protein
VKKRIYFIHSRKIDYNDLIYLPVLRSEVLHTHELMLPESENLKNVYYKDLINDADLIVVELSNPDIGFNMELKQAILSRKPILALANKKIGFDMKYQKLLKNVYGYETEKEFREYVEKFVLKHEKDPRADVGTIVLGNIKEN